MHASLPQTDLDVDRLVMGDAWEFGELGSLPLVTSCQGKKWEEMSAQLRAGDKAVLLTFFFLFTQIIS